MKTGFYNIGLDILDQQEALERCSSFLESDKSNTLFFLNAHCFNIAQQNAQYAKAINESELLLNDGIGIKLAAKAVGLSVKENLNGTDLIPKILSLAAKTNQSVFFLGGRIGVARKACTMLKTVLPILEVAGCHSGYFDLQAEDYLVESINQSGATVLVLGMGVPRQELWAMRNKSRLSNVRLIIGGGAILDFLSQEVSRAPLWVRKISMEWLYRFYLEPRRMWKRYTAGIIIFFYHVIRLLPKSKIKIQASG